MEHVPGIGHGGDPAVDTDPSVRMGLLWPGHSARAASPLDGDRTQIQQPRPTHHGLSTLSDRQFIDERRTEATAIHEHHDGTDRHDPTSICLLPTNCFQRHTQLQRVAPRLRVDRGGGGRC